MAHVHYTTTDLFLAAYLMYKGAEIQGITKLTNFTSSITLTRRGILRLVDSYNSYRSIRFSPRAFAEKRDELKKLIKAQPEA